MPEKPRIGELVWAKVLELAPNGAILELEGEEQGFLPFSEAPAEIGVGTEVVVKVIGYDPSGRPLVSVRRVSEADLEEAQFHRGGSGIPQQPFRSVLAPVGGEEKRGGAGGVEIGPVAFPGRGRAQAPPRPPFPLAGGKGVTDAQRSCAHR